MKYPGLNSKEDLWRYADQSFFLDYCNRFAGFVGVPALPCYDIGEYNPKVKVLSGGGYWDIKSLDPGEKDFNRDKFEVPRDAKTIFCFEILEHLTNPQFFLENITRNMQSSTVLYLSIPARLKILWGVQHFHEIDPSRLKRWLLEPLNLKVVREGKIQTDHSWKFYFTGFRPLLRLFFNHTYIYKIKKVDN